MGTPHSHVIIGNGIAGVTAAEILREEDSTCDITIVADDPFPAYYRPALKDFLGGHLLEEKLWARPATFYRQQRIRFIPARVTHIHPSHHVIQLHNGTSINYHTLLLANGARSRRLACSGLDLAGVSTLRTVADYQEILRRLESVGRVVVSGSGTLALESAETLRHCGYRVTHLLRGRTLWSEVLDSVASDMVLQEERRDGIDVRIEEEIAQIVGKDGQVSGVLTTRGEHIPCELVLIAIGIEPLIDFIRNSGIACGRGVKVDNRMRTSESDIYAAGDVIETTDKFTGRTRVLGQWFPAIHQAQVAAYGMLATSGHSAYPDTDSIDSALYNATFLYGLDFVSVGLTACPAAQGFQELVAEPQARSYRKAILYNGRIVGALLLGDRGQAMALKRAIDHHSNLLPIVHQLFAETFDLEAWLSEQGVPGPLLSLQKTDIAELSPIGQARVAEEGVPENAGSEHQDMNAYFVPIPHPGVHVFVTETQLNKGVQGQAMIIGRQAGVSWLIDHSSVSRLHAEITRAGDTYLLRDTNSSNGTFVNGLPLASGSLHQLRQRDQVRFGDVQFRFDLRPRALTGKQRMSASATPGGFAHLQGTELHANASRLIPGPVLDALTGAPTLVLMGPDGAARTLLLTSERRYLLGRDPQNDIVLVDTSTSRQHAEIFSAPDGYYIRDLNSRYGVFVNQVKINNIFHLSHGDRVTLGNMLIYFSHPQTHVQKQIPEATVMTHRVFPDIATRTNESRDAGEQRPIAVGLEHRKDIKPLARDRLAFEIDMCIGCNRCMDACPVPISSQVTIASLNHATVARSVTPIVARFTHECVMCGSCVPVCPVDNHRDLLMLSLKQRLGVSWESRPDMERVASAIPTGWALLQLTQRLREQTFLRDAQHVPDTYLLHIIAASRSFILEPGEVLLREGEYGRDLYLILDGQVELTATNRDKKELPVALLRRGEYVGEDGMLTGQPYKFSARAQRAVLLSQVPEQVMQRLMDLVPGVRQHFESFTQTRSLYAMLTRMKLFEGVADPDLQWIISRAVVRQYERSERLFAEDTRDRPARETLHILLEGFVKVARQRWTAIGQGKSEGRIIAYRQGGDYFLGGLDLLGDGQAVTVTTINRCRVAEVPRQAIVALFQRYPEVEQRFSLRLREYIDAAASTRGRALSMSRVLPLASGGTLADPGVQDGLHALVSDGVVEGTEVLVIDLDKCIHCNECEYACERRHGHSRMNRRGIVIGNISVVTACRQCQDPVCLLCSRAGIARRPNGEVYITESCIGCGICAERCPYGAISIAQIDDEAPVGGSWQRFSSWFSKNMNTERARKTLPVVHSAVAGGSRVAPAPFDASPSRSGYDELRKKIAIKCDLCAGYSDQACVQACPAGAAIRIQPTRFFGSTEEILRR